MSESNENTNSGDVKLNTIFAVKVGMSQIYDEAGELIPVTVLKYETNIVSQVKTEEKDGYTAVQVALIPKRVTRTTEARKAHLKPAGFENGATYVREIRQALPEGVAVGQKVSIDSIAKGDVVALTSVSKGKGFAGSVKRWHLAGGPATHGSHFHRRPGSSGNRTWPGRVMPGKKFPGHLGAEATTVKNVQIVDVIPQENVVLVKGAVPGARNTLVTLMKA